MRGLAAIFLCLALPAQALELTLQGAIVARSQTDPAGSVRLPTQPWSPDHVPGVADGVIHRQVLRLPDSARTTLQLIAGLRENLENEGFSTVFACANAACGGFDFRFQLDILGEPDMYVDLGDYRYLLMERDGSEPHLVSLVASRSATTGFVHVTTVSAIEEPTAAEPEPEVATPTPEPPAPPAPSDLIAALTVNGHGVLPDLDFGTGSSTLGPGPYPSLETLAAWLKETPSARIILVGHSDSVGSLDANTALSRRRAESVARYLIAELGADRAQIQAAGAGYLAPVSTNLTEEGRAANRRVEAVLLSTE